MTLANKLTVARILFIPILVLLLLNHLYRAALLLFALSALTDAVDGIVARRFRERTHLGSFLDPMADKLLLLASYICLAALEKLPPWIPIVIISRDLIVVLGWVLLYILLGVSKVAARNLGKWTTALQMLYCLMKLAQLSGDIPGPLLRLEPPLLTAMLALTALSLLDYILLGNRQLARGGHH